MVSIRTSNLSKFYVIISNILSKKMESLMRNFPRDQINNPKEWGDATALCYELRLICYVYY